MRAVEVGQHGGPEVYRLVDVARPDPADNTILVHAAARAAVCDGVGAFSALESRQTSGKILIIH